MAFRERIEDIGRICEKLDILTKHELFDWQDKIGVNCRNKETAHYFLELDK